MSKYLVKGYHEGNGGTESLNTRSLWKAIKDYNRLAEWDSVSHYELYLKNGNTIERTETISLLDIIKLYIKDLYL